MPLRPGEEPGNAIAVFPFLKTSEPIRLGSLIFRSTLVFSTKPSSALHGELPKHFSCVLARLMPRSKTRLRSLPPPHALATGTRPLTRFEA